MSKVINTTKKPLPPKVSSKLNKAKRSSKKLSIGKIAIGFVAVLLISSSVISFVSSTRALRGPSAQDPEETIIDEE
ncbi:hypothetical protein RCL1_005099 [Eukaryota sp. TZLM3-RCL]